MILFNNDCLEQLKSIADNSIDSIVTDPPYGLAFMGKKWDYDVPSVDIWKECLRVLKPGGHLLSFGGTRTYHRMVINIEDAGFEIRDQIMWIYASGFPKSLNIAKEGKKKGIFCDCNESTKSPLSSLRHDGLSKTVSDSKTSEDSLQPILSKQDLSSRSAQGKESKLANGKESSVEGRSYLQENEGQLRRPEICPMSDGIYPNGKEGRIYHGASLSDGKVHGSLTNSNRSSSSQRSQHSKQSDREFGVISNQQSTQTCGSCGKAFCNSGLGTALKPANEPICLARKPISEKTVASNVLKHGTGAMNIDESRIDLDPLGKTKGGCHGNIFGNSGEKSVQDNLGRWPANVIFDEEAGKILDEQTKELHGAGSKRNAKRECGETESIFGMSAGDGHRFGDSGGASRFFYCAKTSKSERNAGLEGMPEKRTGDFRKGGAGNERSEENYSKMQNFHPTVKPIKLMSYLIKLITPPGGIVLDPFMGSGSTGVAAKKDGFKFVGIERDEEYFKIAKARVS